MRPLRPALLLTAVALAAVVGADATDTYRVDPAHSNVGFKIRHLVGIVTGRFADFGGTVRLEPADLTRSSVEFTVKASSIDTAEPKRDEHLRSADFFDVAKFPEIRFASTKITKGSGDTYQVTGQFTLHGTTKEITIPVDYLGSVKDPWGNDRAGFATTFNLNRKEYGVLWNKALDSGGFLVGDDVTVTVNVEAGREKPAAPPASK